MLSKYIRNHQISLVPVLFIATSAMEHSRGQDSNGGHVNRNLGISVGSCSAVLTEVLMVGGI